MVRDLTGEALQPDCEAPEPTKYVRNKKAVEAQRERIRELERRGCTVVVGADGRPGSGLGSAAIMSRKWTKCEQTSRCAPNVAKNCSPRLYNKCTG
jgi:hypothetical protein